MQPRSMGAHGKLAVHEVVTYNKLAITLLNKQSQLKVIGSFSLHRVRSSLLFALHLIAFASVCAKVGTWWALGTPRYERRASCALAEGLTQSSRWQRYACFLTWE